ncbi:hypothetical protein [Mammaliicoccus fleurettii]|uniref:hypothetical protein n=1 Tax=Mammaliicoccus fleurettii TaxID=150056 RepID=UPI001AAD7BB3|nr:hypothetical protein [Mammaliicoccus fleurettii]MBO3062736.1 hypothetical protein [Mammaliicoccus fleurettii]
MGLFSHIDKLLSRLTEDETEKWLRFHDELDKKHHRKYSNPTILTGYADEIFGDYEKKNKYATGGLQEKPREIDPVPFLMKGLAETEKLINPNYIPKINSREVTRKEKVLYLIRKDKISSKRGEELLNQITKSKELNYMDNPRQKTNSFNNQFILQSNSDTHKANFQCVVCGSFNIYEGVVYTEWHVAKKTIICGDCNNKFSKRSD